MKWQEHLNYEWLSGVFDTKAKFRIWKLKDNRCPKGWRWSPTIIITTRNINLLKKLEEYIEGRLYIPNNTPARSYFRVYSRKAQRFLPLLNLRCQGKARDLFLEGLRLIREKDKDRKNKDRRKLFDTKIEEISNALKEIF